MARVQLELARVRLLLLGLLAGDLALFGQTVSGFFGVALIVIVLAVVLRLALGRRWLHR